MRNQTVSAQSLVAIASLLQCACFPFYGNSRNPAVQPSVVFVDGQSGEPIAEVLVIPLITDGMVAGLMRSHSEGLGALGGVSSCLALPFVHTARSPMLVAPPKTIGIFLLFPQGFVGRVGGVDGALLAAPGYRADYLEWRRLNDADGLALTPLGERESVRETSDILRITQADSLSDKELARFRLAYRPAPEGSGHVGVCLDLEDRLLVRSFLSQRDPPPNTRVQSDRAKPGR